MALKPGQVLGTYEIVAPLGAGGMGEVYRAVDRNLDREVAIKVLGESQVTPSTFRVSDGEVEFEAKDEPERLARLENEAKLLASLNHPNIATLFGFFKVAPAGGEDLAFLAMELVDGETLEDRIARRPLSVEEAIGIFEQVAEGLEAAHAKGVTHRDLKPANVMIADLDETAETVVGGTSVGLVKILDFGLARVLGSGEEDDGDSGPGEDVTLTYASNQRSKLRGTLGYLSPEQARGKGIDKRADIWAFGCCLFECLTGRRTFRGQTVTDTLSEILKGEPRWDKLPPSTPPAMRRLLRRCLAKSRTERLRDIGDARLDLEEAGRELREGVDERSESASWTQPRLAALALVAMAVGAVIVWQLKPSGSPSVEIAPVARLVIGLPDEAPVSLGHRAPLAMSADGRTLVYTGTTNRKTGLYRRPMDRLEAEPIAGTEGGRDPFFAPDGRWLGFLAGRSIKRVPMQGGQAVTVSEAVTVNEGDRPIDAVWGPDDTIVFSIERKGLFQVPVAGGSVESLTEPVDYPGLESHFSPEFLPGGKAVVFSSFVIPARSSIHAVRLDTREVVSILEGAAPSFVGSGHLVFAKEGDLWAVAFDPESLAVQGAPVRVLEDVLHTAEPHPQYQVTRAGTLVYMPGGVARLDRRVVWVGFDGREEPVGIDPADWSFPRLSPDGSRIALSALDGKQDVWVYDLERQAQVRFSFGDGVDVGPVWTRDGRRIAFSSAPVPLARPRLRWKAADGTGEVEKLGEDDENLLRLPGAFTLGDTELLFTELSGETGWDVWAMDMESREERPLLNGAANERTVDLSSDGRWLAYESDESGPFEIYVRPFPDVEGGRWQISTQGGREPSWSPDGRRLFFRSETAMYAVEVDTREGFRVGRSELLFEAGGFDETINNVYDLSHDGDRFLMVRESSTLDSQARRAELRLIQNWSEELRTLVPVAD